MKNLTLLSIALLTATVMGCKNEKKTADVTKFEENQVVEIPDIHQELYGIYTGAFFRIL